MNVFRVEAVVLPNVHNVKQKRPLIEEGGSAAHHTNGLPEGEESMCACVSEKQLVKCEEMGKLMDSYDETKQECVYEREIFTYQCKLEKGECAEFQHVENGKHARVEQRLGIPQQHRRSQQLPKHARREETLCV